MAAQKCNNVRVVAFDCDGVMFDTTDANKAYYNRILAHVGKPEMTPEQFAYTHMHTVDEAIAYLLPEPTLHSEAMSYRKKMSYLPFLQLMRLEPDLKPLLGKLKPAFKTAIATNRTDTMNRVLQTHELEGLFDMVVTAMDVIRPRSSTSAIPNSTKPLPRQQMSLSWPTEIIYWQPTFTSTAWARLPTFCNSSAKLSCL